MQQLHVGDLLLLKTAEQRPLFSLLNEGWLVSVGDSLVNTVPLEYKDCFTDNDLAWCRVTAGM